MILRVAEPSDAARLYALKRACFGPIYLPYTVFASPNSAAYLRALTTPALAPRHPIFVAEEGDLLAGYVQAVVRGDPPERAIHLNYIGVHPEFSGRGLGRDLLRAFEREGRAHRADRATLDVFDSNRPARDWYARAGYRETSRDETGLLDLATLRTPGPRLDLPPDPLAEEARQGFSKADVDLPGGRVTLGLLGGAALRLMAGSLALAPQIAAAFPERALLVVSGDLDDALPWLDRQTSLRMEKRI